MSRKVTNDSLEPKAGQVSASFVMGRGLSLTLLAVIGVTSLAVLWVRLPLQGAPLPWKMVLFVALGIIPLIFFDTENRARYLCFTLLMSGLIGLVQLGVPYLNCLLGEHCVRLTSTRDPGLPLTIYAGYALVGFIGAIRFVHPTQVHSLRVSHVHPFQGHTP